MLVVFVLHLAWIHSIALFGPTLQLHQACLAAQASITVDSVSFWLGTPRADICTIDPLPSQSSPQFPALAPVVDVPTRPERVIVHEVPIQVPDTPSQRIPSMPR
jgi:hypothetical protein